MCTELMKNQLQFSSQISLANLVQIFDHSNVGRMVGQETLLLHQFIQYSSCINNPPCLT
uniref:Uncharacterized protein n=1 Tax=Oryza brachyantha TaxID=4533 RepID=J3LJC4_ORYBR